MTISGNPKESNVPVRPGLVSLRDRWWWSPLAVLFKVGVRLRHFAFDIGLKRSKKGALPSIVLGNITVGGTGKTPHVMALLQALAAADPEFRWAILSRGYGRTTKGYRRVERSGVPADFGDEPLELCRRFPEVAVAVSEDRLEGLAQLKAEDAADAVLLDDGFQHRRLDPTYSIVLVDATQPVDRDHFLPRGRLRDLPERLAQADAVVISRCPDVLTKGDLRLWRHRLHLKPEQLLLHSGTMVEGLRNLQTKRYAAWPRNCIAVTGIAHPAQFESALVRNCRVLRHFAYPDHHVFTAQEIEEWTAFSARQTVRPEAIITTEKDASRLREMDLPADMPILVMGIQVKWWDDDALRALLTSIRIKVDASLADPDI